MISFLKSFNVKNIILSVILSLNLNITHAGDVIHLEVEQLEDNFRDTLSSSLTEKS
jgi:hypothetical protein